MSTEESLPCVTPPPAACLFAWRVFEEFVGTEGMGMPSRQRDANVGSRNGTSGVRGGAVVKNAKECGRRGFAARA